MAAKKVDVFLTDADNKQLDRAINDIEANESIAEMPCNFPEMLSDEKLAAILKKFTVLRGDECDHVTKEAMMEMYHRFILPLPRRTQLQRLKDVRSTKDKQKLRPSCVLHEKTPMSRNFVKADVKHRGQTSSDVDSEIVNDLLTNKLKDAVKISVGANNKLTKPVKLKRNRSKMEENRMTPRKHKSDLDSSSTKVVPGAVQEVSNVSECAKINRIFDRTMEDSETKLHENTNNAGKRHNESNEHAQSKLPKFS